MQITLDLPDNLNQTDALNQNDWLREIAVALFQQELITLSRASKIAGIELVDFQKLLADRGISTHYNLESIEQGIQLLTSGQNQVLTIPQEFTMANTKVLLRKEGQCLIIEPISAKSLLSLLSTMQDITDDFPDIDEGLLPLDDVTL